MERNTLELDYNSLFIEKIKNELQAAEADFLAKVCSFSTQRTSDLDSSPLQPAELSIDQDADAITRARILLPSFLRQSRAQPYEIIKHFGQTVANTISDLNSPFILLKTLSQGKFP
ncbi:MAG: hypothetical protein PVH36_05565 [Desulfobacterales bacterium]|jgi:hypothetical protein